MTEQCRLVTEANSSALRSIFAVHEDESPLGDLAGSKLLAECVQQILDDDIYVHQTLEDASKRSLSEVAHQSASSFQRPGLLLAQ